MSKKPDYIQLNDDYNELASDISSITKKHEKLDDNALSGFLKNFGIGTEIQETEEQKVERIRTEIASKK